MKTILELCRALPDSEAELRARADEFNAAVAETAMGWHPVYIRAHKENHGWYIGGHYPTREACAADCTEECEPVLFWASVSGDTFGKTENNWNPLGSIADAKAATDALKACCIFRVTVYGDLSCTATAQIWEVSADNDGAWVEKKEEVEVEASTEEAARSACALLAANALSA